MIVSRCSVVMPSVDIDALSDEVEGDYDVDLLKTRRRGRPSMGSAAAEVVPVRLDPALKQAVESRAEREQTTTSEIIREALRRYLDVA